MSLPTRSVAQTQWASGGWRARLSKDGGRRGEAAGRSERSATADTCTQDAESGLTAGWSCSWPPGSPQCELEVSGAATGRR